MVALKGGLRKQAIERRLLVPFTIALCNTLLYLLLLKICKAKDSNFPHHEANRNSN